MQIVQGLQSHQVLQRNAKNVCRVRIWGRTAVAGILQIRVAKSGRCLQGFNYKPIARVGKGAFSVWLTGVPVGGPYTISLRLVQSDDAIGGEAAFEDILVGDVWILAGQSNMQGAGYLKDAAKSHPQVRAFYMDDHWAVAKDPIHQLDIAVDRVHTDINGGRPCEKAKHAGTGPGVAFGRQMYEYTTVPQGLIACAHGGTSMSQWDPAMKKKGGASLYGAMLRKFVKNGSNAAGVVWYQGCYEGFEGFSRSYTSRMKRFVAAVRRDFGNRRLPFVTVQIAGAFWGGQNGVEIAKVIPHWNSVQEQQRALPRAIKRLTVVPAIDLSYDDLIHIGGRDQNRLGRRLARAAMVLINGRKWGKPPIEVTSVSVVKNKFSGTAIINVDFTHVEGSLRADGKAHGFNLLDADGKIVDALYRVDLRGSRAILHTHLVPPLSNLVLYYGWGLTTYCNITDAADRSLPVFGPVKLHKCK